MKKMILLILIFLIILMSTACLGKKDGLEINAGISQVEFIAGGMGLESGGLYRAVSDLVPDILNLTKEEADVLPVYVNQYPTGKAGEPAYEVIDEVKQKTIENIIEYVKALGENPEDIEYNKYSRPS